MRWPALLVLLACWTGGAAAQERVVFPSRDAEANGGTPTRLTAFLFRPEGAGPFPAVTLHHGCNGTYAPGGGRLNGNMAWWARHLRERGMAALVVDSFGSRGETEMCTRGLNQPVPPGRRAQDAAGALAWLRARPDIDPERIALMGWSHGGSTALWAAGEVASRRRQQAIGGDFRLVIAFYPLCRTFLALPGWRAALPLVILHGEADDWTPASHCLALADAAHRADWPLDLYLYPDAHHAFDAPGLPLTVRQGIPLVPGGRVTMGTNGLARAAAIELVEAELDRAFAR